MGGDKGAGAYDLAEFGEEMSVHWGLEKDSTEMKEREEGRFFGEASVLIGQ